jgi:hypothetical protein
MQARNSWTGRCGKPKPGTRKEPARSAAVTWGQIADIAYQPGELDEAAELQHKRRKSTNSSATLTG